MCVSFVDVVVTGYDSTLVPLDFQRAGQIVDDDILRTLVKPMRKGVNVTVLVRFICEPLRLLDLSLSWLGLF
jgi:metacaspase-1